MDKRLAILFLSIILLGSILPMVSAARFEGFRNSLQPLHNSLNGVAYFFGNAEALNELPDVESQNIAVIASYMIVYFIIYGVATRLPAIKDQHEKMAKGVAFGFTFIGLKLSPLTISLIAGLGPTMVGIMVIGSMIFMIFGGLRGGFGGGGGRGAYNTISGAQDNWEDWKNKRQTAKRDKQLRYQEDEAFEHEKGVLDSIKKKINEKEAYSKELVAKLKEIQADIKALASLGNTNNPVVAQQRDAILKEITALIPGEREESEGMRVLDSLFEEAKAFELKEFKLEQTEEQIEEDLLKKAIAETNEIHNLTKTRGNSKALKFEKKMLKDTEHEYIDLEGVKKLSAQIHSILQKKHTLLQREIGLKGAVEQDTQNYKTILNNLIASLSKGEYPMAFSIITDALNLKLKEEEELKKLEEEVNISIRLEAMALKDELMKEKFMRKYVKEAKKEAKDESKAAKVIKI